MAVPVNSVSEQSSDTSELFDSFSMALVLLYGFTQLCHIYESTRATTRSLRVYTAIPIVAAARRAFISLL